MTMRKGWMALLAAGLLAVSALTAAAEEGTAEPEPPEITAPAILAEGTCGDNLTWVLDEEGTLTISGEGDMEDYSSNSSAPWRSYRTTIQKVVVEDSVTSIGSYAFYYSNSNSYYNLTEIILPDSLTSIGSYAFYNCDGLTSIVFPDSLTSIENSAFAYCDGLTSLEFPDSLTSIGSNAFYNCDGLTSIVFPDSLTSIGTCAFYDCDGLTSLEFPESLTSFGDGAFSNCVGLASLEFPDSLTSIGAGVFSNCIGLTSIEFPDSLTSIENSAFAYCYGLTSLEFPDSLTSIGNSAFYDCDGLTSLEFPASLTSIGSEAFRFCDNLKTITVQSNVSIDSDTFNTVEKLILSDNVTSVNSAFRYITTLKEIEVNDTDGKGLVSIDGVLYTYDSHLESYTLILYPASRPGNSYTVVDGTEIIARYAFNNADLLEEVIFPDSLIELEGYVFSGCDNLSTVTFGRYITTVSYDAFYGVSSITKVILPAALRTLPSNIRELSTLTEFEVPDAGNTGYRDIDGVLYYYDAAKDLLTLTKYPRSKADTEYTIADGTAVIGESAFASNSYLTEVNFPDTVEKIEYSVFSNCSSLSQVNFNEGLTSIGNEAFYYCSSLTTVDLPESLTSIGSWAFYSCSALMTVDFPKSLKSIGDWAFADCIYLKEIHLPASLTSIFYNAFFGCTALRAAYFYGNAPTYFYSDAFTNTHPTFTIYYSAYRTGWTTPEWNGYAAYPLEPSSEESYTLTLSSENTKVLPGNTVYVDFTVDNDYMCGEIIATFYYLEYDPDNSTLNGAEVTVDGSEIRIIDNSDSLKSAGVVYTLAFTVTDRIYSENYAVVKCHTALFSPDESTLAVELIPAEIPEESYAVIFTPVGMKYKVQLHEIFTGNASVTEGEDYTFTVSQWDGQYYDYGTVTVKMGKYYVDVIDNGDGSYTIENVNGDLVITGERTPKKHTLTRDYPDPWEDTAEIVPSSTTMFVEWVENTDYRLVSAYYADGTEEPYEISKLYYNAKKDAVYYVVTLSRDMLMHDITFVYEEVPEDTVVCLDNLTECEIDGYRMYVNSGEAYSFELLEPDTTKYSYTVTAMVNGETVPVSEDNFVYTIAADDVEAGVMVILVEEHLLCTDGTTNHSFTKYIKDDGGLTETAECDRGCGETDTREYHLASGTCGDNLTWKLSAAGVLTISGEGEMTGRPWRTTYSSSIRKVIIEEGVIDIYNDAFVGCDNLTEVILPDTLVSIGEYAFEECESLKTVTFGTGLETIEEGAFSFCTSLNNVILPEKLKFIGTEAFWRCTALTDITIQSDIQYDEDVIFYRNSLKKLTLSNAVTSIPSDILEITTLQEIHVNDTDGEGFVSIDGVLYSYDSYLEAYTLVRYPAARKATVYTIMDSVEIIGERAFYNCDYLKEVTLPDSVITIESSAFSSCGSLNTVMLGCRLISISGSIFSGSPVTKVIIPDSVTNLPNSISNISTLTEFVVYDEDGVGYRSIDGVLYYATKENLTLRQYPCGRTAPEYVIPEGTTEIGEFSFEGNESLRKVTFPDSVREISQDAFYGCTNLTVVHLNEGLLSIGNSSFAECTLLKNITFPSTLQIIRSAAFMGCTYLKEVHLPASIYQIQSQVFQGCTALRDAYFYGKAPSSFGSSVFKNTYPTFTIHYIDGKSGWTTPEWNGYPAAAFNPVIASGNCGDTLAWSLDGLGNLTISGTGAIPDYTSADETPWNPYSEQIKQVFAEENVTSIGSYAFADCTVLTQIHFAGDAPAFGENVFSGVTAEAYYPADNTTWTEEVMQNYGGTITWKSYETAPFLTLQAQKVYKGSEFTVDLTLRNAKPATSLVLSDIVIDPDYAELLDAEWLLDGAALTDINAEAGTAAIAFDEAVDMNGTVLRLYLKAGETVGNVSCGITCTAVLEVENARTAVKVVSDTIHIYDYLRGDTNGDDIVTSADAIYLLRYTILPERYPLGGGNADYNGDGEITADDAVYLLYHALMPEKYPIEKEDVSDNSTTNATGLVVTDHDMRNHIITFTALESGEVSVTLSAGQFTTDCGTITVKKDSKYEFDYDAYVNSAIIDFIIQSEGSGAKLTLQLSDSEKTYRSVSYDVIQ